MSESAVLEIRTYKLVAGSSEEFDRLFREGALPMLRRHGIRVVGFGRSADDDDHYYLARAFLSAAEREQQLDSFYDSEEWQRDHREGVLALIETYHTVVIDQPAQSLVDALTDVATN